ncbi:MAG: hypothetical protein ACKVP0_09900 [Pirellulaceae bacterium]
MRADRLVLVLMLLSAMTSAAEAQLLPRRRVAVRVGEMVADFGARVTMEGMKEGLNQATDELGDVLDLRLSLAIYAQIQMAPRANQPFKNGVKEDRPRQDCLGLLLAETARLAARLEEEKLSPPVLEKMVLDYHGIGFVTSAAGDVKEDEWSSRQIEAGGRSVTCVERHQPLDPGSKSPRSVHCSFVFLTKKEGQEFRKTVDFDLYLEKEKREGPPVSPWKVKNLEYDKTVPEPKV